MNTEKYQVLKGYRYPEHPRVLFFLGCLSFFFGIFFGSDGMDMPQDIILFVFPLLLGLVVGIRKILRLLVIVLVSLLGYMLSTAAYSKQLEDIRSIEPMLGEKHSIVGTVEKKLYKTELNQAYRLSIDNFANISPYIGDIDIIKPDILIEIPENLTINIGDVISFTGKVEGLYKGAIDGFEKYAFYQGLAGRARINKFIKLQHGASTALQNLSKKIESAVFRGFPRDTAGIVLGMTIGNVELMSQELKESFKTAGISHILVVSGSNITFLIVFLGGLIRYFPINKNIRLSLIFVFVLLYSTLVGWDVPVMRSTIMGLLGYYAMEHSSKLSSISILLGVGGGFLIYSPLSLVYDPAFGLSFVATMSIILYYKKLCAYTERYNIPLWMGGIISLSLSATIGTLPITLYHFGETSLGVVFANIAIAIIVGWILFFSVWYMLLGFLGDAFLYIFGYLVYVPVAYIITIAEIFGGWGMGSPRDDIQQILILIFLVLFLFEILSVDRLPHVRDQKKHGLQ